MIERLKNGWMMDGWDRMIDRMMDKMIERYIE